MSDEFGASAGMNEADRLRLAFYLQLSRRQREIVCGVLRGMTNREIAATTYVVPGAVANRLTEIYAKLDEVPGAVVSRRAARFDVVRFFGDFFTRYPELDKVGERLTSI